MSHGRPVNPVERINVDHADDPLAAARALGGPPDATSALADHDTDAEPNHVRTAAPHRRPRWVKVSGMVVGVLVLALVILRLTGVGQGAGGHGPGMHGGGTPPPNATETQ